ncbi:MAG: DnaB-like helicase C-terminal domain-containing protein [bacterium]
MPDVLRNLLFFLDSSRQYNKRILAGKLIRSDYDENVPVLVLSQLSREVEKRVPQIPKLSDLRESGAIEQDADVVLMIYREDKYNENSLNKNVAKVLIEKHRNGPTGGINLYFDENRASFRNLDKNEYIGETGEMG